MIKLRLTPRVIAQQETCVGTRYFCDRGTFIDCVETTNGVRYYKLGPCVETTLPSEYFAFFTEALESLYEWINTKDFMNV